MIKASSLIGISGKAGAGKDSAYGIIRKELGSRWQNRKFGSVLKEIVSLLTGLSAYDLESQEVKTRSLGKKWECWEEDQGPSSYPILRTDVPIDMYPWTKRVMTPRYMMQLLGTEVMRGSIHPDVWVNALFKNYYKGPANRCELIRFCEEEVGLRVTDDDWTGISEEDIKRQMLHSCEFWGIPTDKALGSKWVITDVRFPNEVRRIQELGGIVIRLNRPDNPICAGEHPSETELDDYRGFNAYIDASNLEELESKIKKVINKYEFA